MKSEIPLECDWYKNGCAYLSISVITITKYTCAKKLWVRQPTTVPLMGTRPTYSP